MYRKYYYILGPIIKSAWAPITVFVIHIIISKVFLDLYDKYPIIDVPMHYIGGVVITFFYWNCYRALYKADMLGSPNKYVAVVLLVSLIGTTTVLWEFAEFTADYFFNAGSQAGLEDTIMDMLMGVIGGLSFIILNIKAISESKYMMSNKAL